MKNKATPPCPICHLKKRDDELIPGGLIRESIEHFIKQENPAWSPDQKICLSCLNAYRAGYVQNIMKKTKIINSSVTNEIPILPLLA